MLRLGLNSRQSHLGRRKHGSASALESTPTLPTTRSESTSPYDQAFQQHLIDHGIYPNKYKYPNGQVLFTNLEDLTDGSLVPGNPDRYHSARPEQLDQQVRTQLDGHIVPNFFLTAKGPDGSLAVAKRQACYDGALGARGMNSLQTYGDPELDSDNKAYTLTSIYHGGTLTIYANYPLLRASL